MIVDDCTDTTGILVVPLGRVTNLDTNTVAGTLYFDATAKKVTFKGATDMDLSINEGTFDITDTEYVSLTEEATVNGTIIGAETSTAPGVLVLESTTKALILPKMANPHLVIINPESGMIAYDTVSKMFCVFNGQVLRFAVRFINQFV